jgi:lysyl-tRNA synthetase, class II
MASRLRGPLIAAARVLGLAVAIIVITTLTTGWLYWMRADVAHWPGPMVRDVLPLDEMPGHDRVPLLACIAAFGVAAVSLGLVARALGLGRLAAGLSLAAGVGVWLFLVNAVCLFIVRQEPFPVASREAAGLQPMYLEAAMAGAGGALLGRSGQQERRNQVPVLLAWMVAAGGLLDLISALFPHPGQALAVVERFGPGIVVPAVHALLVPAGALLLVGARGLARRSRRAWELSVTLLGLSAVLHLILGPDYAATIVTGLIAVALVARRQDFTFRGEPGAQPPALLRLAAMLALAVVYGLTAIWVYQMIADVPFNLHDALLDTLRGLVGMRPLSNRYLPRSFSWWFPFSVLSIAAIGLIWAAEVWSRPWRQRFFPDGGRRERATQIVRQWGCDTLAPFTLRADKEWFITGQTLIAYRVVRGIAVVGGDPVGPLAEAGAALDEFLPYLRARGWHVAVLGASGRLLQAYRDRGLHPMYQGSEAVIDVATFSLEGRRMRAVRQAVHRLARRGYRAEAIMAGDVPPELREELTAIDRAWLQGGRRKGFTMELDSLFRLGGSDAMFMIGRDENSQVAGCLHLAVCAASRSLSLSSIPRRPGTPNGFSAWLIVNAVSWARRNGFERVSLNFAPFADLLSAESTLSSAQRLERGVLMRLKRMLALQLDNLVRFNGQFGPAWEPRYVVVERRADLPRVAVAAMAAEGYLPHADLVRGAAWMPPAAGPDGGPEAGAGEPPGEEPAAPAQGEPSPPPASQPPAAAQGEPSPPPASQPPAAAQGQPSPPPASQPPAAAQGQPSPPPASQPPAPPGQPAAPRLSRPAARLALSPPRSGRR